MIYIQLIFTLFWATLTTPTTVVESPQNMPHGVEERNLDIIGKSVSFFNVDYSIAHSPLLAADKEDDSDDDVDDSDDDSDNDSDNDFSQNYWADFELTATPTFNVGFYTHIFEHKPLNKPPPFSLARPIQKRLFILFNRMKLDC